MYKRGIKAWLIVAATLICVGLIAFAVVMTSLGWDFSKLSTVKYQTTEYTVTEDFRNISIETDTADIVFTPSADGVCRVICHERRDVTHAVSVKDGVLTVLVDQNRAWYTHIGIFWGTPCITVELPEEAYAVLTLKTDTGDVDVPKDFTFDSIDITADTGDISLRASSAGRISLETDTGDICIESIAAHSVAIDVSTGDIRATGVACEGDMHIESNTGKSFLDGVTCKSLSIEVDTGDVSLTDVAVTEKLRIELDTGDVAFKGCDAASIFVETDTGDVTGTLLSDKNFITRSSTGKVRVPDTVSGGRCEISTDTGDIILTVVGNR